uniref:olfactomedin-4-like n=1 Tax=Podarcis muralis TaxID=64176 RepID=UPI0010A014E7|nr:olfactomedin-4-like [Podarcis muralis]
MAHGPEHARHSCLPLPKLDTSISKVAADQIIFHDGPIASDDKDNKCICSIELPDTTFPSHLMVILENAYKNLTAIYEEEASKVSNVSSIVWELEKFDENNVLLTHREIATLKKQLADCEDSVTNPNSGLSPSGNWTPEFGNCDNKVLINVSKPLIVKLNWRGLSYKFGAWGKDFAVGNKNPDAYWVAPLNICHLEDISSTTPELHIYSFSRVAL